MLTWGMRNNLGLWIGVFLQSNYELAERDWRKRKRILVRKLRFRVSAAWPDVKVRILMSRMKREKHEKDQEEEEEELFSRESQAAPHGRREGRGEVCKA